MPPLPDMDTLLVRTDFADDDAWDQVRDAATREYGRDGFRAYVEPVSDPQWAGAAWETVKAAAPATAAAGPSVLFIADTTTFDGGLYRGFELPPPLSPAEKAEAEQRARLEEQQRQDQQRLAAELSYWGGTLPTGRLRATVGNARSAARLDAGLAEAIAAASPATQRSIARWVARRACEVAGIAALDWVEPALRALDHGQELPPPFDVAARVWPVLFGDPRVPRTTVVSLDGRIPNLLRPAMAVPALFAATGTDPLDAALQALYHAAVAFGRDEYPALLQQIRRSYGL